MNGWDTFLDAGQEEVEDTRPAFNFPRIKFFPWQEDAWRVFLRNPHLKGRLPGAPGTGPRKFAYCVHRRGGKDILAYCEAVLMCMLIPGYNVLYVHKTKVECKEAIMDGTWPHMKGEPDDAPHSFAELIPEAAGAVPNKTTGVVKFANGSKIHHIGADKINTRGKEVNMVVATECGHWDHFDKAAEQLNAALARTEGLWVGASTIYEIDEWGEIVLGLIDDADAYHRVNLNVEDTTTHEGVPIVTKEHTEELIRTGQMTEAQVRREFYNEPKMTSFGSVFSLEVSRMAKEDRLPPVIPIDQSKPVVTSWDLGSDHPTVILFWQRDPPYFHLVGFMEFKHRDREWVANQVVRWAQDNGEDGYPLRFERHYLPWDAGRKDKFVGDRDGALGDETTYLRRGGLQNLFVTPKVAVKGKGVELMRRYFPRLKIAADPCKRVVDAMKQYRYKARSDETFEDKPDQAHWSADYLDAYQSLVLGEETIGQSAVHLDRLKEGYGLRRAMRKARAKALRSPTMPGVPRPATPRRDGWMRT